MERKSQGSEGVSSVSQEEEAPRESMRVESDPGKETSRTFTRAKLVSEDLSP